MDSEAVISGTVGSCFPPADLYPNPHNRDELSETSIVKDGIANYRRRGTVFPGSDYSALADEQDKADFIAQIL